MRETLITASDTPVSALMADSVVKIGSNATLLEVADALLAAEVGVLAVTDGEAVVGMISERDIVHAVARREPLDITLAIDVATRELSWCDADSSVAEVAEEMTERYIRHVLVERGGELVGMVSARDLLGWYAMEDPGFTD